jgi:uncharacterized protein
MKRSFPPLTVSQKQFLQTGIDYFNRGMFFECHEVLEEAWLEAAGEQKKFLQGLIQVAVAFHHLGRKNLAGAGRLLAAGMEKLSAFAPRHEGVDIGRLLADLEPWRERVRTGVQPPNTDPPHDLPKITWEPPPDSSTP